MLGRIIVLEIKPKSFKLIIKALNLNYEFHSELD